MPTNPRVRRGHNSSVSENFDESLSVKVLRGFIERVESMNEEKKGLSEDMSELMKEIVSAGFDRKTVKAVVKRRAMDKAKFQEEQSLLETYLSALGIL